jgi:hypothetical protein
MTNREYTATLFPDSPIVLGIQLSPLTLGKYSILEHIGCSMLTGGFELTDFVLAVLLCGNKIKIEPRFITALKLRLLKRSITKEIKAHRMNLFSGLPKRLRSNS